MADKRVDIKISATQRSTEAQTRGYEAVRRGPLTKEDGELIAEALDLYAALGAASVKGVNIPNASFNLALNLRRGITSNFKEPT